MNKLLFVAPNAKIYQTANEIISETGVNITLRQATSDNVVDIVKKEFKDFSGIVIARGRQAQILKNLTSFPVVEIVLSVQDMAVLINRACDISRSKTPIIAFIGFQYMFSKCEKIARILNVDMRIYYAVSGNDIKDQVFQAKSDGVEIIIGGEIACSVANDIGIKSIFIDSARESIQTAIQNGIKMLKALQQEQKRTIELSTLINYSFDAILRLDSDGIILEGNGVAEKALQLDLKKWVGESFFNIENLYCSEAVINSIKKKQNLFSTVIRIGYNSFIANIAAINLENQNDGFIISMQEFRKINELEVTIREERKRRGYFAVSKFEDYKPSSEILRSFFSNLERVSQFDIPIFLNGAKGNKMNYLAECIHNASIFQKNPFVSIDVASIPSKFQSEYIFGSNDNTGQINFAEKGTLFLQNIHLLNEESQCQLLNMISNKIYFNRVNKTPISVNVRIVCSTDKNLTQLGKERNFNESLAFQLNSIKFSVPAVVDVPEEIPNLLSIFLAKASKKYKKQASFTSDAILHLCRYNWPGNIKQIEDFCIYATLLANDYQLGVQFIKSYFNKNNMNFNTNNMVNVVINEEEIRLRNALRKNAGNRTKTAKEMKISRTTLWRKIKQYDIAEYI